MGKGGECQEIDMGGSEYKKHPRFALGQKRREKTSLAPHFYLIPFLLSPSPAYFLRIYPGNYPATTCNSFLFTSPEESLPPSLVSMYDFDYMPIR
jgi:hypothetical protein